jgi:hypothetical protein
VGEDVDALARLRDRLRGELGGGVPSWMDAAFKDTVHELGAYLVSSRHAAAEHDRSVEKAMIARAETLLAVLASYRAANRPPIAKK